MKKIIFFFLAICFSSVVARSQITKPATIKKTQPAKLVPAPPPVESVYSITAAKVTVKTGNDNKEQPSKVLVDVEEKDGIWGKGRQLFSPVNGNNFQTEIKVNSQYEFPLTISNNTAADAFTLTNLQGKGLKFIVYYMPNFGLDAWRIESVSVQFEFKDQSGRVHPTYGNVTLQFPVTNGLLTGKKTVLVCTTDNFLMSQGVAMGEPKDFW